MNSVEVNCNSMGGKNLFRKRGTDKQEVAVYAVNTAVLLVAPGGGPEQ